MVNFDGLDIYKTLLNHPDYWLIFADTLTQSEIKELCTHTLTNIHDGKITRTDHLIIAYISLLIGDSTSQAMIKHVVVDESQDYHAMDYAFLSLQFPKANFTILGDVHQSLHDKMDSNHHFIAQKMLHTDEALHMKLTTAYRNASGISDLCLGLFQDTHLLSRVNREGKKPMFYQNNHIDTLQNIIKTCFSDGHQTVAVITKTMDRAKKIIDHQLQTLPHELLTEDTFTLPKGLIVSPVYFAKGMEFDAVIIADADEEVYSSERDRQHLYIATSRALHELHLVSNTKRTSLLDFYFK
jgi:DNA helicase-2/ATP-dependent DNA helicase PcrA